MARKKPKKPLDKRRKPVFKKRPDGKKDTGAPLIVIDLAKVRLFSQFHPSDEELAAALDVCPKTFSTKKAENPEIEKAMMAGRAKGRFSLRGKQFQKAMDGDNTMLIWAGKQLLDQKEKTQIGEDPDAPFSKPVDDCTDHELIDQIAAGLNELGIKVVGPAGAGGAGGEEKVETVSGAANPRPRK